MSDLISRQAILKHIEKIRQDALMISDLHRAAIIMIGMDLCDEVVKNLPSAPPEIIRCGECKWFQCNMRMDGYLPKGVDEFECRHWCGSCDPVDFCSHAERRTDE